MDYTIQQHILTKNDCYKEHKLFTPKGIMVHSTAARGAMAEHFLNGWNAPNVEKCVHAFIDKDGIYQTLPFNVKGWHCAGAANNTHLSFEICEPYSYTDKVYFANIWDKATWFCAYLCKQYNLTEKDIICHCEGHKLGIASNHADVMHWFPQCNKNMDDFRSDVGKLLHATESPTTQPTPKPTIPALKREMSLQHPYMQGDDVKELQQQLTKKNFACVADGVFGEKTETEVKAFQKAHGLVVDGIVGAKTWNELWK